VLREDNVVNIVRPDGLAIDAHEPVQQYPALTAFEPVQLATPQLLHTFWPHVEPLFTECVNRALHGEFEASDLLDRALSGQISIMVIANDRTGTNPNLEVKLAAALEAIIYPKYANINILAFGGRDVRNMADKFWVMFKGWCLMNGARSIEASVNPYMERLLRPLGFKVMYRNVRCSLTENSNGDS